jgi:amidase
MAKTVTGAALLLQAMIAPDPTDPGSVSYPELPDLLPDPSNVSLDGNRIGVFRSYYGIGTFPEVDALYDASVEVLRELGAEVIDPITYERPERDGSPEFDVLLYEFKAGLNDYLANHDIDPSIDTLAELITWNETNAEQAMPIFGQSIFIAAQEKGGLDATDYLEALEASNEQMRTALSAILTDNDLDALFIPVNGPAWKTDWIQGDRFSFGGTSSLAAVSGYPSVVVPAGLVHHLPIGVGFVGTAFAEPELIQMAFAFEQATAARQDPQFIPSLEIE